MPWEMYFLYRWWNRYRTALVLVLLSLGMGWSIQQTQGQGLLELYRILTLPTQPDSGQQAKLLQAKTWELEQRIAALETQNRTLQTLLGVRSIQQQQAIAAPLIGRSADHWWQQVILGRGKRDGIGIGSVVLSPGGVVGRVTQVTNHTSRVLLVTDPTSKIGVTITRNQRMGILRGLDGNYAVVDFFQKDPDVRIGDTVVTASVSQLFPPSLPIGTIKSLKLEKTANPQAVIELSAPIGDLEWVSVYLDGQTPREMVSTSP